jgi:hypothetical protein
VRRRLYRPEWRHGPCARRARERGRHAGVCAAGDGSAVRGWDGRVGVVWVRGRKGAGTGSGFGASGAAEPLLFMHIHWSLLLFQMRPAFDALQSRRPSCDCGPIPVRLSYTETSTRNPYFVGRN